MANDPIPNDFLGFRATYHNENGFLIFKVDEPYKYEYIVFATGYDKFIKELKPQQAANLVKESIEKFSDGRIVVWYLRNNEPTESQIIAIENKITSKTIIKACFEDYINLPTRHEEKPIKLLSLISNMISMTGANAIYEIKASDFIRCDIPIKIEGNNDWDSSEGEYIVNELVDSNFLKKYWTDAAYSADGKKFINAIPPATTSWNVSLTMHGWSQLSSLKMTKTNKVFIAMAFSQWDKENKKYQKNALVDAIKKACKKYGYEASIVSGTHTDNITDKIISEIKEAKFVVCDFTYQNQGAYYEAGYARALGKPVYHLVKGDDFDRLHFDIKQINCRTWEKPEEVETALSDWIGANEYNK